ncbi:hypothetical protein ATO6_01410 [Oceanicola sp. 22II-s10i]|uniref:hypothetical protein n=1 Tax=Oceanicola sp. 22II-s10i TaxID=1317116 RepID=UPI000B52358E|nr:hypothetical protein [Oceanicola sp. 22II-s10i]OWU85617.1 hypothetical protein ATO6_01410 [Oceanicola sp. 22II-s10i]
MYFRPAFAFLLMAAPAAADPLAICQASNRDFPQSCGCIIERSQQAGLTGPVLDKLLANDTTGVDLALFQTYGMIYVQCIQSAVMATVPSGGGAASGGQRAGTIPQGTPPATPDQAQPAAVPHGSDPAPRSQDMGTNPAEPDGGSARHTASHPRAAGIRPGPDTVPGRWGGLVFGGEGFGVMQAGVVNDAGAGLLVSCGAGRDMSLIAGPFDLPQGRVAGSLEISGGGGFAQDYFFSVIERDYIAAPLFGLAIDRLQSGSEAVLRIPGATGQAGIEARFALSGSSRAIRDLRGRGDCATWRNGGSPAWQPTAAWSFLVSSVWSRGEIRLDAPVAIPAVRAGSDNMMFAEPAVTCDGRFVLKGLPAQRMGGRYTATIDPDANGEGGAFDLWLTPEAGQLTGPMPEGLSDAMIRGVIVGIHGPEDNEPGEIYDMRYSLAGFAGGATGLVCPEPAAGGDTPVTDLTRSGLEWQGFDGPGAGGAERGAFLRPQGAPQIVVDCRGMPSFDGGAFGLIGDQTLRLERDGDAAGAIEVGYGSYRAALNPSGSPALDAFAAAIPDARTLRVTALENPAHDILYPLTGLRPALRQAGCPG